MPGGKGVNVARAIKRLGRPVIATGFAGGATGTRIVEALTAESVLTDFVRIGEESRTNTAVLDPTTGVQTEINERGPADHRARDGAVPRQAALPRAGRRRCASSPDRCRATSTPTSTARLIKRAAQARRDDGRRHRRRAAAPRRARRARRRLAERRSRPRSWSATSSTTTRTARWRSREIVELGAREAIMTVPDGCFAQSRRTTARSCYRVRVGRAGGARRRRLRRRLPRRLRRRALHRRQRPRSACASASPAAPSRRSTSAPGVIDPQAVERLLADGRGDAASRCPPRSR